MAYTLPEILQDKVLSFPWFPTPAQAFVYRNWGIIGIESMSKVLKTDSDTVRQMADAMGLDLNVNVPEEWMSLGYITVIRNNWHLLDYEGLCTLLGWTPDYLAYILKEDDFLSTKLGKFKPFTPELRVEELNEEQKKQTEEIRIITEKLRKEYPEEQKPFDFFPDLPSAPELPIDEDDQLFKERIIYSYCALYGDIFSDTDKIDASFPDAMLRQYKAAGVNGIWTQGLLSVLAPYPFDNKTADDCDKRLSGVEYLINKLEKYGIGLYLYFNEPRSLPNKFFIGHENLRGAMFEEDSCLCISNSEIKSYLFDSIRYVVERLPKLAGIFTITASENHTNCYSHFRNANQMTNCPVCAKRIKTEVFAEVNRIICEAAKSANPDIKIIAYTWGWEQQKSAEAVCSEMPKDVGLMCVSEYAVKKMIQGEETHVVDYSISVEGPGENSISVWEFAKRENRKSLAKIQVNNTWELSTVPMIPVFPKIYGHLKRIAELNTVDGIFLSWTLGGYPSPALKLLRYFKKSGITPLPQILKDLFPDTDTAKLLEGFERLSSAFDKYPFHLQVAYVGPQHMGPANPLYLNDTGFRATMVCFPYNDLEHWKGKFSLPAYTKAWEEMSKQWSEGADFFAGLQSDDRDIKFIIECVNACDIHFKSVLNQIRYLSTDDIEEKINILNDEEQTVKRMIPLTAKNATLGYEASNHYFYTKQSLFEKIINCNYLKKELKESQNNQ